MKAGTTRITREVRRTEMLNATLRVILPLYGLAAIAALMVRRARVATETGHDPIVVRPFRANDTPQQYLESALMLAAVVLAVDVVWNSVAPGVVNRHLAVPWLRAAAPLRWLGLALVTGGSGLCGAAILDMGTSWRVGIDRGTPGSLVTSGLFGRIRHPIYAGMLLVVTGMACATGDVLSTSAAAAAWVGIPIQARLEEDFLFARHGDEYNRYRAATGRFWPGHR